MCTPCGPRPIHCIVFFGTTVMVCSGLLPLRGLLHINFHLSLLFAVFYHQQSVHPGQLNQIVSQAYGYSFRPRLQLWRPFARCWLSVPFYCVMDLHLYSFVVTFFYRHVFCGCQIYVICSAILVFLTCNSIFFPMVECKFYLFGALWWH